MGRHRRKGMHRFIHHTARGRQAVHGGGVAKGTQKTHNLHEGRCGRGPRLDQERGPQVQRGTGVQGVTRFVIPDGEGPRNEPGRITFGKALCETFPHLYFLGNALNEAHPDGLPPHIDVVKLVKQYYRSDIFACMHPKGTPKSHVAAKEITSAIEEVTVAI